MFSFEVHISFVTISDSRSRSFFYFFGSLRLICFYIKIIFLSALMKNLVPIDEVKTKTLTENISVARSESQYQPMSL